MSTLRTLLLCVAACTVAVGCGPVEESEAEPQPLVTQVSALYTEGVVNQWPSHHTGECVEWREPQGCSGPIPPHSGGSSDPCSGYCTNPFKVCVASPTHPGMMACCDTRRECVRWAAWTCTHYDGACSWKPWWPTWYYVNQRIFVDGVGEQWTTGTQQFPWAVVCTNGEKSKGNGYCWW